MSLQKIQAGESAYFHIHFYDKDMVPATPQSVDVYVSDLESDKYLWHETLSSLSAEMDYVLTGAHNNLLQANKDQETHRINFKAGYSDGFLFAIFDFIVMNPHIPVLPS